MGCAVRENPQLAQLQQFATALLDEAKSVGSITTGVRKRSHYTDLVHQTDAPS